MEELAHYLALIKGSAIPCLISQLIREEPRIVPRMVSFRYIPYTMTIFGLIAAILTCMVTQAFEGDVHSGPGNSDLAGSHDASQLSDFSFPTMNDPHLPSMEHYSWSLLIPTARHHLIDGLASPFFDRTETFSGSPDPTPDIPSSSRLVSLLPPATVTHSEATSAVPSLKEILVPVMEQWHILRSLGNQLVKLRINPGNLRMAQPLVDARPFHLRFLQQQLQRQLYTKHAVYITPDMTHTERVVALPTESEKFKKAVVELQPSDPERVSWALVSVKPHPHTSVTWLGYALLDVPSRDILNRSLEEGRRIKTLAEHLKLPS
ncbi:hypothetical protein PHSY_005528 [Pseudozyma hubeiensis SY62]|uniref:Uncharacterized protein n=1 Tax=Pseudozyma hubeiensis (strain SY62) TaxID=1305764 RepID=R9PIM1_PSEHS|nr:hypothetical protein PHSY_005528 [Pseudozyma hubeiensis SY62]GAC97940.1 hypothetical protein PHSY_005528 [Pseudozyma hubeiensis SY62]